MRESRELMLRVWGPWALFTRQELKVDRVTHDVITPSAARGVFEAILWKPQMAWQVSRIEVLRPIRTQTMTLNEVKVRAPSISAAAIASGAVRPGSVGIDPAAQRTQRTSTVLRDVEYVLHARVTLRDGVPDPDLRKYVEMFERRAGRGQCFHHPYLGVKEFAADFALVGRRDEAPPPIPEDRDLGLVTYDPFDGMGGVDPTYFRAAMRGGVIEVPRPGSPEVLR